MAKTSQTSKKAKTTKLTKMAKITTAVKMVNFSKLAEMAEVSNVARVFKFSKFAKIDKMSQMAGIAKTIKRHFDGRTGRDSHIQQNDLSDQDSQLGAQWPGLAEKDKMVNFFEFDRIAENQRSRIEKKKIGKKGQNGWTSHYGQSSQKG